MAKETLETKTCVFGGDKNEHSVSGQQGIWLHGATTQKTAIFNFLNCYLLCIREYRKQRYQSLCCLFIDLVGWSDDWLFGCSAGRLVAWLVTILSSTLVPCDRTDVNMKP
jgi:hypothetical protein